MSNLAEEISDCIDRFVSIAKQSWPNKLKDWNKPFWCFNLQGTTAGLAYYKANKIHLNHGLLIRNKQDFLSQTIPHEIAHLVAFRVFGESGIGHGKEWKFVMRVFGIEPNRCHKYDVSETKRKRTIKRYLFSCGCESKLHEITPQQFEKVMQKKCDISCRRCEKKLIFAGKIKTWVQ